MDEEGTTYKLGTSQQLFVNIFWVSGWKCAVFFNKIYPQKLSKSDTPADFVT